MVDFAKSEVEKIDELTNEIMDKVRSVIKLNPDSDADDKLYGSIHSLLKSKLLGVI